MTSYEALNAYIKSLPLRERKARVADICETCAVTPTVVKDWRLGRTRIKPVYMDKITETIGEDIFAELKND